MNGWTVVLGACGVFGWFVVIWGIIYALDKVDQR